MATAPANDIEAPTIAGEIILLDPREVEIGERLREIDPVWAEAIGRSMQRDGQIHAIHVCRSAGGGWMLAGPGGHRLMGARAVGIAIEAKEVSANQLGQRRREAAENFFRRKDDPVERAAAIAELVRLHKLERGIDPAKDGRAASASARWQKAVADEAADAKVTMTLAYGWNEAVASQIGVSPSLIKRDLMLYRRLAPSLVSRLRERRHPAASNAAQLRALAQLDSAQQEQVVDALLRDDAPAKSVSDALRVSRGSNFAADPGAKRLSAFIGAFSRMSLAERKGALEHLRPLLPAGFALIEEGRDA